MQAPRLDTPQVHPDVPQEMRGTRAAVFFLWNRGAKGGKKPTPVRHPVQASFSPQIKVHVNAKPFEPATPEPGRAGKDDFVFS